MQDIQETQIVPAPVKRDSKIKTVASELGLAFAGAAVTSTKITFGITAGLLSAGFSGLAADMVTRLVSSGPVNSSLAFAAGVAFQAPFVHHIFNGRLQERLFGQHTNGAFTKSTKATSYVAGAVGALALAGSFISGPSSQGIETYMPNDNFERRNNPRDKNGMRYTSVQTDANGPVFVIG